MTRLSLATALSLLLLATPALAANAPKFTASCPTGISVTSNGKGKIRINKQKAQVKSFSDTAWEARISGTSIDIGRDGGELTVTYTGKGGANGICQVTSTVDAAGAPADNAGVPSKDDQACLAAVSRTTNNGDVQILDRNSSEANNTVIIGVGPDRAKWRCLVKNGKVADVMSLTDEGAM